MRYALLCILSAVATAVAAAAPDPVSWEPASAAGPALFIAEPVQVEDFRNPHGADYACRVTQANANTAKCFSNACGLESITFKTTQVLAGTVPAQVRLNRILGEWCTSVSAAGRKFLVAVQPDRHWTVFEIVEQAGKTWVIPDYAGCVGDVDLKPLLAAQGIELAAAGDRKLMMWRLEWHDQAPQGACGEWIAQDQFQKALPLATVVDSWKNKHP